MSARDSVKFQHLTYTLKNNYMVMHFLINQIDFFYMMFCEDKMTYIFINGPILLNILYSANQ